MNCEVCGKEAKENLVVCSDRCEIIRIKIHEIVDDYFPTNGCDACWGDLTQGCTDQCKNEFVLARKFSLELWELIHFIMGKEV